MEMGSNLLKLPVAKAVAEVLIHLLSWQSCKAPLYLKAAFGSTAITEDTRGKGLSFFLGRRVAGCLLLSGAKEMRVFLAGAENGFTWGHHLPHLAAGVSMTMAEWQIFSNW